MRNEKKEEIPSLLIDRSPVFIIQTIVLCATLIYFTYWLLSDINPWGFMMMVPAAIWSFQTLWWLLTPFALIFDNRIEIKQSLFHEKIRYFVDISEIKQSKNNLLIKFNDDETEAIHLFGIKASQLPLIQSTISKAVDESIKNRE